MNSSERLATAFEKTAQFFFFIRWLGRVLNNINGQYGHYLPPFAWAQVILSISGGGGRGAARSRRLFWV